MKTGSSATDSAGRIMPPLRLTRLYNKIRTRLGKDVLERLTPNEDFSQDVRTFLSRGDQCEENLVRDLRLELTASFYSFPEDLRADITVALISCAVYYDCLGDAKAAIEACSVALEQSVAAGSLSLMRRAHSILGVMHSRVYDYEAALVHLESAVALAVKSCDPIQIVAALSNTAAALRTMGLMNEARLLACTTIQNQCTSEALGVMQFSNATNAISVSHTLGDLSSARSFLDIATRQLTTWKHAIANITLAYYESNKANQLILGLESSTALASIDEAILLYGGRNNRVDAILYCAKAGVCLSTKDVDELEKVRLKLEALDTVGYLGTDREELLRKLVAIYSMDGYSQGRSLNLRQKEYESYLINIKHGKIFEKVSAEQGKSLNLFKLPGYDLPKWFSSSCDNDRIEVVSNDLTKAENFGVTRDGRRFNQLDCDLSRELLSIDFRAVQGWVLAAESRTEGSFAHCLMVGELAGVIAAEIGFERDYCERLELACRLHDVGKVVDYREGRFEQARRSYDNYKLIVSHTTEGAALLQASVDPIFILAVDVARSHHEFWNGTGYPTGLAGESIPVSGRICAVADSIACLLLTPPGSRPWSFEKVREQLQCLAGVQLDPDIVRVSLGMKYLNQVEKNLDLTALSCKLSHSCGRRDFL